MPDHINTPYFTTTESYLEQVLKRIKNTNIYISSVAVSDYAHLFQNEKISSKKDELVIRLYPLPKLARAIFDYLEQNLL